MRGPKTELDLYEMTLADDGMGGQTETPSKVKSIKGYLRTMSGSEKLITGEETIIRTHRFYCSFDSAITEKRWFQDSADEKYDIENINNIGNMGIYEQIDLRLRT